MSQVDVYLIVLVLVGTIIIGLIGFLEQIAKEIKNDKFNSIFLKIGLFIIGTIAICYGTYQQAIHNSINGELQKQKASLELARRDSLHNERERELANENIKTFTNALAPFGLKYDSSTKVIEKLIRDSSRVSTEIKYGPDPNFVLMAHESKAALLFDSVSKKQYTKISLRFISEQSPARNIYCRVYIIYREDHPIEGEWLRYVGSELLRFNNLPSIYHRIRTISRGRMDKFAVYLHGTYTNLDASKKFNVSEVYTCDNYGQFNIAVNDDFDRFKHFAETFIK